ncbi:MAG TPA: cold shock domain-containing protein [Stellaceae bacterium]|nr:cold shock domain-containing protein [Stellaceae bacterium]
MRGLIKMTNPEKGFGFIHAPAGAADIFFGEAGLDGDIRDLRAGDAVEFDLMDQRDGRVRAIHIRPIASAPATAGRA